MENKKVMKKGLEWIRTFTLFVIFTWFIQFNLLQLFVVDGYSMNPTLANQERVIVNKLIYEIRPPKYGEIFVFKAPPNPSQDFIKRVIGLPGDVIEVRNHTVYRNGNALFEPYLNALPISDFPPSKVPPNYVFGMGDNRNHSEDSRSFGPIPMSSVIGRADVVLYPFNDFKLFPFLNRG